MGQKISNNSRALLAGNITAIATTLTVEAGKADSFPVANTGDWLTPADWFRATIEDASGNIEIIKVGVRASGSGVFSVILRGQEGTTPLAFSTGAVVELRLTAADIETSLSQSAVAINRNGDTISGVVNVPTAALGTNTQQIASTAFAKAEAAAAAAAVAPGAATQTTAGIAPLSTNAQATAGSDNTSIMTPLRVAQAILARIVAATTSVAGIAPIATTAQMNAGADDSSIVTPGKLFGGGSVNLSPDGHIRFPTWLFNGFTVNWGTTVAHAGSGSVGTTMFSAAFNNRCASVILTDASGTAANAVVWAADTLNLGSFTSYWNQGGLVPNATVRSARYIAVGY